jgi:hypothetical protein
MFGGRKMNNNKIIEDYFAKLVPAKNLDNIYFTNDDEKNQTIQREYDSRVNAGIIKFKRAILGPFRLQRTMPLEDVAETLCAVGMTKNIPEGVKLAKFLSGEKLHYNAFMLLNVTDPDGSSI